MSREGAESNRPKSPPPAGTPIWVWLVYGLGILAATIVAFSVLFTAGALLLAEDDVGVSYDLSVPATVLWGGLILAAAVTWFLRRRQKR